MPRFVFENRRLRMLIRRLWVVMVLICVAGLARARRKRFNLPSRHWRTGCRVIYVPLHQGARWCMCGGVVSMSDSRDEQERSSGLCAHVRAHDVPRIGAREARGAHEAHRHRRRILPTRSRASIRRCITKRCPAKSVARCPCSSKPTTCRSFKVSATIFTRPSSKWSPRDGGIGA